MKRLWVFDIDGTLTDTVSVHQACFEQALLDFGGIRKQQSFGAFKHHTDRYIFRKLARNTTGNTPSEEEISTFYDLLISNFDRQTQSIPVQEITGAASFISLLEKSGECVVFATGSIKNLAKKKLEFLGVKDIDKRLEASDHIDSREGVVAGAIAKGKQYYLVDHFSDIVAIGDGIWDFHTAMHLELDFLGIGNNPTLSELLRTTDYSIWPDFSNKDTKDSFASR